MKKLILLTLILFGPIAFSDVTFQPLTTPYIAHADNKYERYSGQWMEFESIHPSTVRWQNFRSISRIRIREYLINEMYWKPKYIATHQDEFNRTVDTIIMDRTARNLGLLKVVRYADRFAKLTQSEINSTLNTIISSVTKTCKLPASQQTNYRNTALNLMRTFTEQNLIVKYLTEDCQYETEKSEGSILSPFFRGDYTKEGKTLYSYVHGDEFNLNGLDQTTKKVAELALETIGNPLHAIDDLTVKSTTLLSRPEWKLFFVTVGVGGGNGHDLYISIMDKQAKLEYHDFDGDIFFSATDF